MTSKATQWGMCGLSLAAVLFCSGCGLWPLCAPCENLNENTTNENANTSTNGNENEGTIPEENIHAKVFAEREYTGTQDCLWCHAEVGEDVLASGHWNWEGTSTKLEGREDEVHGKIDLINDFCIAIDSNEGRCTQCHIGYGWSDDTFDFDNPENVDCLVCHDGSGTYAKAPTTAGLPAEDVDLGAVARSVGPPSRDDCGACHFYAGGGDNVKRGDLGSALVDTTRDVDVHMGTDGGNFTCQTCHRTQHHQIAGMQLHPTEAGGVSCTNCHNADTVHQNTSFADLSSAHLDAVACQACHIPAVSKAQPTKVFWDWSTAGQDIDPIPVDEFGKETYNKKKGTFEWGMNVRPVLAWFNGQWEKTFVGDAPHFENADEPVDMAHPVGDIHDLTAKLYPFKVMRGKSPADPVNRIMLVPHLFGPNGGSNAFWSVFNWPAALAEGAAYAGQDYSGEFTFVETRQYYTISHEVSPAAEALGCNDCHNGGIDFEALGYEGDPMLTGGREN